jgi:hypothetical protein
MDADGWIAPLVGPSSGGTVKACDVTTGECAEDEIETGITTPSSITFDKRGDLWVVESMFFEPEIRLVDLD